MILEERVLDLEAESSGSSLALSFTTVILGGNSSQVWKSLVASSVKWGQQFLVLVNDDNDDG